MDKQFYPTSDECYFCANFILELVTNSLNHCSTQQLAETIIGFQQEIYLQQREFSLKPHSQSNFVSDPSFYRDSICLFSDRLHATSEQADWRCLPNSRTASMICILKENFKSNRLDLVCMLILDLSFELKFLEKYQGAKFLNLAEFMLSEREHNLVMGEIHHRLQCFTEMFPLLNKRPPF